MEGERAVVRERAGVDDLRPADGPLFLVIGVFDGLHRGHLYLIERLVAEAAARGARPAVLTFDSHPDELIAGAAPPLLVDPAERVRLLGDHGVEVVVVQHFDAALRATEYDDFVARITARTPLAGLLMTPDAAFGRDRRGTPDTLAALGAREGFDVVVAPPFRIDGDKVSSSAIRALVAAGDLAAAERLLGRPYEVVGAAHGVVVSFPLPVALPPDGPSEAIVDGMPQRVVVDRPGGRIVLERSPAAAPVRIRFV